MAVTRCPTRVHADPNRCRSCASMQTGVGCSITSLIFEHVNGTCVDAYIWEIKWCFYDGFACRSFSRPSSPIRCGVGNWSTLMGGWVSQVAHPFVTKQELLKKERHKLCDNYCPLSDRCNISYVGLNLRPCGG